MILNQLLLIPIIGAIIIAIYPLKEIKNENLDRTSTIKKIALITSIINFILSLYLWIEFDSSSNQYQFLYNFDSLNFCHFNLGIDGISLYFVLLTTFLTPLAIFSNMINITKN